MKTSKRPPSPLLSKSSRYWLLLICVSSLLPHVFYAPAWISAASFCLLVLYAAALLYYPSLKLNRPTLLLISILLVTGIVLYFGNPLGKNPGIATLSVLLSAKLHECRHRRDAFSVILLALFVQGSLFLFDQNIWLALYAIVPMFITLATLGELSHAQLLVKRLRDTASLLGKAIPLMLVLFFAFPRIDSPLWGLPQDVFNAHTGLSESMQPGNISTLAGSAEAAFYVDFSSAIPEKTQLYWRGPVLGRFNGQQWLPLENKESSQPRLNAEQGQSAPLAKYTVTLEAHGKRWLLALDFPLSTSDIETRYNNELNLLSRNPVITRVRYQAQSLLADHVRTIPPPNLAQLLHIPANNQRTVTAIRKQISGASNAAERLGRLQQFFLNAKLGYTLNPGTYGKNYIDEFLFDRKQGFCEHYAASFALAARIADIPARIVTGYLGGEVNPLNQTMVVRQSDAHAWVEVWLPETGWLRIDPTAIAHPLRLNDGLVASMPNDANLPVLLTIESAWLKRLNYQLQVLNYSWNQWVLGYNRERQQGFFEQLGIDNISTNQLVIILICGGAFIGAFFIFSAMRDSRRQSALDVAWQQFCRNTAKNGVARASWEGPIDYSRRLANLYPQQAEAIKALCVDYARQKYAVNADNHGKLRYNQQLIRRLKKFIPQ